MFGDGILVQMGFIQLGVVINGSFRITISNNMGKCLGTGFGSYPFLLTRNSFFGKCATELSQLVRFSCKEESAQLIHALSPTIRRKMLFTGSSPAEKWPTSGLILESWLMPH